MTRYRNLNGNSGIFAYESGSDRIVIQFNDGGTYLYSYSIPGSAHVERMKVLALNGSGLNSFISTSVRKRYAAKLR